MHDNDDTLKIVQVKAVPAKRKSLVVETCFTITVAQGRRDRLVWPESTMAARLDYSAVDAEVNAHETTSIMCTEENLVLKESIVTGAVPRTSMEIVSLPLHQKYHHTCQDKS